MVLEEDNDDRFILQNKEVDKHKERCYEVKINPLIQKSKEEVEEDLFWDDLEKFCANLDVKPTHLEEENHEQQENSVEISIFMPKQSQEKVFTSQQNDEEATLKKETNKESSKFIL